MSLDNGSGPRAFNKNRGIKIYSGLLSETNNMSTAQILNIIGIIFLIVSFIIFEPILIYLSIAFIIASIIYWRMDSNKKSKEEQKHGK